MLQRNNSLESPFLNTCIFINRSSLQIAHYWTDLRFSVESEFFLSVPPTFVMNNSYEQDNNSISIFIHDIHPSAFPNLAPEQDTFHPRFRKELKLGEKKNILRCSRKQINTRLDCSSHFHRDVKRPIWVCNSRYIGEMQVTLFLELVACNPKVPIKVFIPWKFTTNKMRSFWCLWWMLVGTE